MWFIFLLIHFFSFVLQLFSCKMGIRLPNYVFVWITGKPERRNGMEKEIPH